MTIRLGLWLTLIGVAAAVSGCAPQTVSRSQTTFPQVSDACQARTIPGRYIIHWNDGSRSIEEGLSRSEVEREILEPLAEHITLIEQDLRVEAISPSNAPEDPVDTANADWGQQAVGGPAAWAAGLKGAGVTVAVIDSGIDPTHPALRNQLLVNSGEVGLDAQGRDRRTNKIDDDGNGYIDDVNGYDFYDDTGVLTDGAGHGTHVAGIVAAEHGVGSAKGLAPMAKILPLDFMDDRGGGVISLALEAIDYAVKRNARVINASWGGASCSVSLRNRLSALEALGVVVVTASGNEGANLDQDPSYPSAFGLPAQLNVGASSLRGVMTDFSNYSYQLVDLVAPGQLILSTWPGGRYVEESGTSMAAPFVAAAAAVLISAQPMASPREIKQALLESVRKGPFAVSSQGQLDLPAALNRLRQIRP
jgi:subtilisin family serine protease